MGVLVNPFMFGSSAATPTLSPGDITGLALWLDASTISGVAHGGNVTSWSDSTANANDATEATNPPTYHDGTGYWHGLPGVLFDADAERLTVAADATLDNAQATYVAVLNIADLGTDYDATEYWIWNKRNTNPATVGFRVVDGQFQALARLDGSEGTTRTIGLATSDPIIGQGLQVMVLRYDGSTLKAQVWANGSLETLGTLSVAGSLDPDNSNTLTIGRHPTSNNLNGPAQRILHDFIVYNNAISDGDLTTLIGQIEARYAPTWERTAGPLFSGTEYQSCGVFVDGSTAYLTYVASDGLTIGYMTASTSTPHTWTDQGTIFTAANDCRKARVSKYGSTWYLYYDDRTNGTVRVASGSTLGTLSDYGSNPILSGTGTGREQYVRMPYVLTPDETDDGDWHMLYDGRQTSPTSGVGGIFHATSSDGLSWTRDAELIAPAGGNGFDAADCGDPGFYYDSTAGEYVIFYAGYNEKAVVGGTDWFPHQIGWGTSATLSSFTRSDETPILALSSAPGDFDIVAQTSPAPYVIGSTVHLYYCGASYGASVHSIKIGRSEQA